MTWFSTFVFFVPLWLSGFSGLAQTVYGIMLIAMIQVMPSARGRMPTAE